MCEPHIVTMVPVVWCPHTQCDPDFTIYVWSPSCIFVTPHWPVWSQTLLTLVSKHRVYLLFISQLYFNSVLLCECCMVITVIVWSPIHRLATSPLPSPPHWPVWSHTLLTLLSLSIGCSCVRHFLPSTKRQLIRRHVYSMNIMQ